MFGLVDRVRAVRKSQKWAAKNVAPDLKEKQTKRTDRAETLKGWVAWACVIRKVCVRANLMRGKGEHAGVTMKYGAAGQRILNRRKS